MVLIFVIIKPKEGEPFTIVRDTPTLRYPFILAVKIAIMTTICWENNQRQGLWTPPSWIVTCHEQCKVEQVIDDSGLPKHPIDHVSNQSWTVDGDYWMTLQHPGGCFLAPLVSVDRIPQRPERALKRLSDFYLPLPSPLAQKVCRALSGEASGIECVCSRDKTWTQEPRKNG